MLIDQVAILFILCVTFSLFTFSKWRYDVVSLISLILLFITHSLLVSFNFQSNIIIDKSQIFLGFGHPAVITVVAVLIISRALHNSGVVDMISREITPYSKNKFSHIFTLSSVASILSGLMNNVGALALMMPVAVKTSAKQRRSPTIILMPLAFASILGGMITMIGTPPNIIIANFRKDYLESIKSQALLDSESESYNYFLSKNIELNNFEPSAFSMFDFSPVGLSISIIGIIFITILGWRFIPKKSYKKPGSESVFSIDEYITEIRIPENCKLLGLKINEVEKFTDDKLSIIGTINDKGDLNKVNDNYIIKEDDKFLIKTDPVDLKLMMNDLEIRFTKKMRQRIDKLKDDNTTYKELLITPESKLNNRNRTYLRRCSSNSLTLMAVARRNKPIRKGLSKLKFKVGDVLLIQGNADILENLINTLQLIPFEEREVQIGVYSKITLSLSIFIGVIILSVLGFLPTTLAFILAILLYVFTGILPMNQLYRFIDWPIIILLGSMIPLSNALESTGTSAILANVLVSLTEGLPIWMIIAIIMIITMCLSDIINNAATALIMAPIAAGIGFSLNLNIDPFLMSVAVGASCAFLTPIGHQCNAIILGPGGYKFSDYWKMGLPLEIIIVMIGTPLILYFWPV